MVTRIGRDSQTGLITRSVFATSLREPVGLTLDARGRLLVAEEKAGRVLRFEADGTRSVVATRLEQPRWLAADERGTIYVSASGLKRPSGSKHRDDDDDDDTIVAVSPTGVASVFVDGFENVEGLAVSDGALYAAGRGLRYKGQKVHERDGDGVVYRIPILASGRAGTPNRTATRTASRSRVVSLSTTSERCTPPPRSCVSTAGTPHTSSPRSMPMAR